jgi:hypothetical protein
MYAGVHYKMPRELFVVDPLPQNAMGKVNKKTLLEELGLGTGEGGSIKILSVRDDWGASALHLVFLLLHFWSEGGGAVKH